MEYNNPNNPSVRQEFVYMIFIECKRFKNEFFTWLELNGYSKQEQNNIADKLEYEKNFVNNECCLLYEYILNECET